MDDVADDTVCGVLDTVMLVLPVLAPTAPAAFLLGGMAGMRNSGKYCARNAGFEFVLLVLGARGLEPVLALRAYCCNSPGLGSGGVAE